MSSAFLKMLFAFVGIVGLGDAADARELKVCGDPNNLPFSNVKGEGFENKIAALIAAELGADLSYYWWPQRRGFVRNTLDAGECDLVTGTVLGLKMLRGTIPYYRSSYMFVTRQDAPAVVSLDDLSLRQRKIGIQLVGGDNPPPASALARRGLADNLRGFPVYGDDRDSDPAEKIMAAVATGDVDVAIVWGPVAGYYGAREKVPLALNPVQPAIDGPRLPMVFDITMGVRKGDAALRDEINAAITKLRPEIDTILAAYGVPRLDGQFGRPAP